MLSAVCCEACFLRFRDECGDALLIPRKINRLVQRGVKCRDGEERFSPSVGFFSVNFYTKLEVHRHTYCTELKQTEKYD